MSYEVVVKNSAKGDLRKIKRSGLRGRFMEIVAVLKEDSYRPTDGFEKLQPYGEGRFSRRINLRHRVVYRIVEAEKRVEIYSAWSHYE